jgi:DNA processing protein
VYESRIEIGVTVINFEDALKNISYKQSDEAAKYEYFCYIKQLSKISWTELKRANLSNISDRIKYIESHSDISADKRQIFERVKNFVKDNSCSVIPFSSTLYPDSLRQFHKYPEVFYSKGDIDLLTTPSISIVGTRKPSKKGFELASNLSELLCGEGITIVSGLAEGIDIAAQSTAIRQKGNTIAVIGTPIDQYYPKQHKPFQDFIAENHLLISQVSFLQYENEPFQSHRNHFPERNILMAAIADATIIMEAGETSGTRTQAEACLKNNKPLFIHQNLLDVQPNMKWVEKLLQKGARIISADYSDLISAARHQFDLRNKQPEEYSLFG